MALIARRRLWCYVCLVKYLSENNNHLNKISNDREETFLAKSIELWQVIRRISIVKTYLFYKTIQIWYCLYVPFEWYFIGRGNYHHQYLLQKVKVKS